MQVPAHGSILAFGPQGNFMQLRTASWKNSEKVIQAVASLVTQACESVGARWLGHAAAGRRSFWRSVSMPSHGVHDAGKHSYLRSIQLCIIAFEEIARPCQPMPIVGNATSSLAPQAKSAPLCGSHPIADLLDRRGVRTPKMLQINHLSQPG